MQRNGEISNGRDRIISVRGEIIGRAWDAGVSGEYLSPYYLLPWQATDIVYYTYKLHSSEYHLAVLNCKNFNLLPST